MLWTFFAKILIRFISNNFERWSTRSNKQKLRHFTQKKTNHQKYVATVKAGDTQKKCCHVLKSAKTFFSLNFKNKYLPLCFDNNFAGCLMTWIFVVYRCCSDCFFFCKKKSSDVIYAVFLINIPWWVTSRLEKQSRHHVAMHCESHKSRLIIAFAYDGRKVTMRWISFISYCRWSHLMMLTVHLCNMLGSWISPSNSNITQPALNKNC